MIVPEYGQFKLDESLAKLQPFQKRVTSKAKKPQRGTEKKASFKQLLVQTGKGVLSVALAKYLGISPETSGRKVAEATRVTQASAGAVPAVRAGVGAGRIPLKFVFLIGGVLFVVSALFLFRRK